MKQRNGGVVWQIKIHLGGVWKTENTWIDRKGNQTHTSKPFLFPSIESPMLQIPGSIQKENIIVPIDPSSRYNFLHVDLPKHLQMQAKNIKETHAYGEKAKVYDYLKFIKDKYVLHSNFMISLWMVWALSLGPYGWQCWDLFLLICKRNLWSCGTRKEANLNGNCK